MTATSMMLSGPSRETRGASVLCRAGSSVLGGAGSAVAGSGPRTPVGGSPLGGPDLPSPKLPDGSAKLADSGEEFCTEFRKSKSGELARAATPKGSLGSVSETTSSFLAPRLSEEPPSEAQQAADDGPMVKVLSLRRGGSLGSVSETTSSFLAPRLSEEPPSEAQQAADDGPMVKVLSLRRGGSLGSVSETTSSFLAPRLSEEPPSEAQQAADEGPLVKVSSVRRGGGGFEQRADRNAVGLRNRRLTIETKLVKMMDHLEKAIESDVVDEDESRSNSLERVSHPAQEMYTPGKVCSVWGRSTEKDVFQPFFSGKALNIDNLTSFANLPHMIGVHCQRGQKLNMPNQDDFCVVARQDWLVFGVMDGHGTNGHMISHFVQEHIPKRTLQHFLPKEGPKKGWTQSVKGAFEEVSVELKKAMGDKASSSGTTCSLACLSPHGDGGESWCLHSAFVGDSAIVYGRRRPGGPWQARQLGESHKPDREDELARIHAMGGQVLPSPGPRLPSRVILPSGGLAMSRAMGDFDGTKCGVISEPEVPPDVILEDGCEHIILVCSDGIWDVLEPAAAVQLVAKFASDNCQIAAEKLAAKAQLRWQEQKDAAGQIDDITVIVVRPGFGMGRAISPPPPAVRSISA